MKHEFSKGETVRIRKGAFAAFTGKVVAIDYDNEKLKLKVSVKVLPSADSQLLEVGFLDVEKVRFS